jgi:hypothetical protein
VPNFPLCIEKSLLEDQARDQSKASSHLGSILQVEDKKSVKDHSFSGEMGFFAEGNS